MHGVQTDYYENESEDKEVFEVAKLGIKLKNNDKTSSSKSPTQSIKATLHLHHAFNCHLSEGAYLNPEKNAKVNGQYTCFCI